MIPAQLQNPEFRFTKVRIRDKRAYEAEWPTKNHAYDAKVLESHLRLNGNYGVITSYGGLGILDIDNPGVIAEIEKVIPVTFTVQTSKGRHYYYILAGDARKVILEKDSTHYGELQAGKFFYVVGPGSTHPTGVKYQVTNDAPIARIAYEELRGILKPYMKADAPTPKLEDDAGTILRRILNPHAEINLTITDVITLSGLKRHNGEYQGSHPFHGSETGNNFCCDPARNVWFCFRHNAGGGALELLAVKHGIISCGDAGRGSLKGEKFTKTLEAGGIPIKREKSGFLSEFIVSELARGDE